MQISENKSGIIGCFLAEEAGQACIFSAWGVDTNACGGCQVAKATVRIEAESEIGTARKIAEFLTCVLQSMQYS